jgi:diguanylate cyclase (GGDEF)-like protein
MKLHQKILIHSLLGHLLLFSFLGALLYLGIKQTIETELIRQSQATANAIFNNLYQGMLKGFTKKELDALVLGFKQNDQRVVLHLEKGTLERALRELKEKGEVVKGRGYITYRYPIMASSGCLSCHKVKEGDILALLEIRLSYEETLNTTLRLLVWLFFISTFLILFGVYLIGRRQARHLSLPLQALKDRISRAEKFEELVEEKTRTPIPSTGIDEVDAFSSALEDFIQRVKKLAVDKEIFEFDIKLLERFIITSEVVKDWKYYLKSLIIEVNKLLYAPVFFAFFYVEEEVYAVEVFWYQNPSKGLQEHFEEKIKERVKKRFIPNELKFVHNIINEDVPLSSEEELFLKTRELFLDQPKIGGVVGIGLAVKELTETQEIALEAVLTSLLNVTGTVRAISKFTKELEFYATRDPLTLLYNQRLFWELLHYEVERAKRYDYKFAVLVVDLDNFKFINDTYGHAFGDVFLQSVARTLEKEKRKGDILARYGGDEFTLILPMCDLPQAYSVAERIRSAINNLKLEAPDRKQVNLTCSVGVAIFPDHAENAQNLFILADTLMYRAKEVGKNSVVVATTEDLVSAQKKEKEMVFILKEALENKKIVPYFQPIYDLRSGKIFACELLARIVVDGEVLPAGKFIPTAEKLGLITEIDYLTIEKALALSKEKAYQGYVFINLSPKALIVRQFIERVLKLVRDSDFPPENIVFELTEREAVKNISLLQDFLKLLQLSGFKFCIDDFGSGFSSFHYIKHFLVNFVKLEGEFVVGLSQRSLVDSAIVESVLSLCQRLNIRVIAEYVENEEILIILRNLGVPFGQGYFLGKPSPDLNFPDLAIR